MRPSNQKVWTPPFGELCIVDHSMFQERPFCFVLFLFVCSLQTLVLDANRLSSLPAELGSLEALVYLGLSFNRFTCTPPVLEKLKGMERLCLAGNQISVVHMAGLQRLSTRHIDLR